MVVALVMAARPAAAATDAPEAFTPQDRAALAKIERYLNGIDTLRARFVQVSSDGGTASGRLYLARPGRMRFEYDPPTPVLIVSTGSNTIYVDTELDSATYFDLDETPAALFLGDTISLSDAVTVTGIDRDAAATRVAVVRRTDPTAGTVELVFSTAPLALRQWRVRDAQGIETTVTLYELEQGIALDPALFKFERRWPGRDAD